MKILSSIFSNGKKTSVKNNNFNFLNFVLCFENRLFNTSLVEGMTEHFWEFANQIKDSGEQSGPEIGP